MTKKKVDPEADAEAEADRTSFDQFKELTRKLVQVPKSEVDELRDERRLQDQS